MKRLIVCLLVAFSLMLGPVAHAAGICAEAGGTIADHSSKEKKQDNDKLANAGHHCCANPVLERIALKAPAPFHVKSSTLIITAQKDLASINVGPLLEPPSHA